MTNPYLIISSDCHAGPETPDYRDFLDPQYREAFDESLRERERLIRENKLASPISMGGDEEFQQEYAASAASPEAWQRWRTDWVDLSEADYQRKVAAR